MMSIDFAGQAPLPASPWKKLPRRAAPCAGLFGWRKDSEAPVADRDRRKALRDEPLD